MITFDDSTTGQRIHRLEDYYERKVLQGSNFICGSYASCKAAIKPPIHFYEGQLSYMGNKYDMKIDGKPLRIVMSGISYGYGPPKVSMAQRRSSPQSGVMYTAMSDRYNSDGMHNSRTKQGKGITLALRYILLGPQSLNTYSDWTTEFLGETHKEDDHIFNMFALVNYLLCSATRGTSEDAAPATMRRNCFDHYMETIKILEPNLVIGQKKGLLSDMLRRMSGPARLVPLHDVHPLSGYYDGDHLRFVFCDLNHPACRNAQGSWWRDPASPYFQDVVVPTLHLALKTLQIARAG